MIKIHSKLIWIILIGLLAFTAYLYWNPSSQNNQQRGGGFPVAVKTAKVKTSPMIISVSSLGTGIANQSIKVTSPTSDFITELNIEEGKAIKKDAVIARLHDVQERARVTELEAVLSDQKRQLGRLKNLATTQATAQSLIDEQQTRVNTSIAQLDIAKAQLAEMTITAPFDGYLGLRQVSKGAYLNSGTVITTLDDLNTLKVEFSVAEHYLAALKLGMPFNIKNAAYGDITFTGKVSAIDTRLDPVTRTITVHGQIENSDLRLRPGMLLQVQLVLEERVVMQISEKALVPQQDKQFVYLVDADNKVSRKEVTIGQRIPGWVEVISGLKDGDIIVIEGTQKLREGSMINQVGA
ncbi:efflux RND transporter periplasmic adaptor subunit [Rheinheimera sp. MMS21-TC3]|uniref:efflux RND transporter periplasmic adaptor subunit n=1 Tax=Rheinheimera sp. MMS21-TC3 TaxID=3072790 RepID=UPI0028C47EF1|nr:efflux RND transporter periplasmic adaptor subunit [Rheinheimera sp. MMS21-TC3]WNO61400.1 efflux RND transporter periplasmic adaptor subunit [Rheinheimera sp. MMS21-TC3]